MNNQLPKVHHQLPKVHHQPWSSSQAQLPNSGPWCTPCHAQVGSRDSSVVTALDLWSRSQVWSCRGGGIILFSRVNFLCWLLFQYSFHSVKDPGHSAKSAGGRLQPNTYASYICGFAWSDMVHGCMVYRECVEMAAVSWGTSHANAISTQLQWIFKNALFKAINSL